MSFINYSSRRIYCKVAVLCQGHCAHGTERHEYQTVRREFQSFMDRLRLENKECSHIRYPESLELGLFRPTAHRISGFEVNFSGYVAPLESDAATHSSLMGMDGFILWNVLTSTRGSRAVDPESMVESAAAAFSKRGYDMSKLPGLVIWSSDEDCQMEHPSRAVRSLANPLQLPEFSFVHGRKGGLGPALKLLCACIMTELRRGT